MKKNKGITLIALIITIIVMLILVAVSVNVLIKSNLIGTAEKAVDKYKTASEEEANGGTIEINGKKYASIEDYINNRPLSTIKINMKVTHEDTAVTADGTKIKAIKEGVPIPVGYYYVGGTKNTGVVISDEESDENKGDAHSVSATLTGNQFVWVPVLQNQKIKIEVTAEDEITSIELLDPTGTEITTTATTGKTYVESVNPTRNGEYKLTVKTAKETNESLLYVSTLYAQDTFATKEDFEKLVQNIMEQENKTEEEILETLPGIGANPTIDTAYPIYVKMMSSQFTDNADTDEATVELYKNSVNKYGGFYIARYEAGSENPRTSSSGTTDAVLSKANKYPYNRISQTESIEKAKTISNGKTNVIASLINGAVWDRTLNWLEETKTVTRAELFDSTSWGNYYNSQFELTGKYSTNEGSSFTDSTTSTPKPQDKKYLLGTGVSEYTKRNNIYDLAGNCDEWTTESTSSSDRVYRGGNCDYRGFGDPAIVRSVYSAGNSYFSLSFRSSLYVSL